jgi:hypothetical protein
LRRETAVFGPGSSCSKSQLGAFINHLRAQRGKGIDAALADAWVAYALEIINAVG